MHTRIFLLLSISLLAACGYKGDLYLPEKGDPGHFGPVQTGLQFTPIAPMPNTTERPAPLPTPAEP